MSNDPEFHKELERIIAAALNEDIGKGDITSQLTIPEKMQAEMVFIAREELVACGLFIVSAVLHHIDNSIQVQLCAEEGALLPQGYVLAKASGSARSLLTGERVALNLMQRLSGVATLTRRYVDAVAGTNTVILDTRKTIPGLRIMDKYAVRVGGGQNHRMKLDDMVLIKDNHIAVCGSITVAVKKVREGTKLPVEVECDTLDQVREALAARPDRILLDNMSIEELRQAVQINAGAVPLEASGGVSLETIRSIARTGVDYISVGKLTHSVPAVDIAADIMPKIRS